MIGAFLFVTIRSFRNRMAVRLRRLREPRYLLSLVGAAVWLWMVYFRNSAFQSGGKLRGGFPLKFADGAGVVMLAILLFAWALPGATGGLEFSEAEIQFLFAGPVSRRHLLLYKFLRSQPQLLVTVTIMSFLVFRNPTRFLSLWAGFAALTIYMMMVALARARLKLLHVGFLARIVIVSALATGLVELFRHAGFGSGVVQAILFVPKLFTPAILRMPVTETIPSTAAVILFGALCFVIAAALNVSFEEASVAVSQRRLERTSRVRGQRSGTWIAFKRMPAPFRLRETGFPELAVVWKNLTAAMRIATAWLVVIVVLFLFVMTEAFFTKDPKLHGAAVAIAITMCAAFPLIGSAIFSQDLRLDLTRLEVLKTFPLTGERIVAAEMAAPLLIVSVVEMMFLVALSFVVHGGEKLPFRFFTDVRYIIVALLYAIPNCGAQLVVRNAVPLLFPAWTTRSKEDPRGIVMTGQRVVLLTGNLLVLTAALIPAAILFVPAFWLAKHFFEGSNAFLAVVTLPSVALLCVEVWLGIQFLGARLEQLDVSNEMDVISH